MVEIDEDQWLELVRHRGGCSCHSRPPCGACDHSCTDEEAIELGFIEEPEPEVDYMHAVRDLCR